MIKKMRPDFPSNQYDLELFETFEIPSLFPKYLNTLSGGMRQKVSAALSFMFNPDILILDEPTGGLDPLSNEQLKNKIRKGAEQGKLTIISSHILSDLDDISDQVAYLLDGEVLFYKSLQDLRKETSENKLIKIIASITKSEKNYVENL